MAAVDEIESIADELRGERFGTTSVEDVSYEEGTDSEDEPAVFLRLTLSDPDGETWPYQDVLMLRRRVLDLLTDAGLTTAVYVSLHPVTDQPQADDPLRLPGV